MQQYNYGKILGLWLIADVDSKDVFSIYPNILKLIKIFFPLDGRIILATGSC
jgi:hypothetical protein